MISIASLWLPILISAVFAFLASSVIHMMLPYHKSDFSGMPGQDELMDVMRKAGVTPGEYGLPWASSMKEMQSPEMVKKFEAGPVAFVAVRPSGPMNMGKPLAQWFVYLIGISIVVAYVAGRTLSADAHYLEVFRVAGTVAFIGYAGGQPMTSIWKAQKWSTTIKNVFDGLVYALLTAGVFGWLWPR